MEVLPPYHWAAEPFQLWPCVPQAGLGSVGPWASDQGSQIPLLKLPVGLYQPPRCVFPPDPRTKWRQGQETCVLFLDLTSTSCLVLNKSFWTSTSPSERTGCKTSKSSSLFDRLASSHLLGPLLPLLPEPSMGLITEQMFPGQHHAPGRMSEHRRSVCLTSRLPDFQDLRTTCLPPAGELAVPVHGALSRLLSRRMPTVHGSGLLGLWRQTRERRHPPTCHPGLAGDKGPARGYVGALW